MTERDDAIYGAFAGGGKDEALTAHIIATRLAEVTRQRDALLAACEKSEEHRSHGQGCWRCRCGFVCEIEIALGGEATQLHQAAIAAGKGEQNDV